MPNLVVYVPAKMWKRLEDELGTEFPSWARQMTVKAMQEFLDGRLSERDNGLVGDMESGEAELVPTEVASHNSGHGATRSAPARSESRPTPANCGMSNRHHIYSKLKPCPRCGYPL